MIRCGITVSQNSLPAEALEVFNESLKKATDGTVRLEVFYDGTMGNERDVIEGVSMGTIEMYAGSTAPLANFVDDFNIWDLPYMVDMINWKMPMRLWMEPLDRKCWTASLQSVQKACHQPSGIPLYAERKKRSDKTG